MLYRFSENNEELKINNCNENDGCQIQFTKIFVQDTVIMCKAENSAGHTRRNIDIKARGKLSRTTNK